MLELFGFREKQSLNLCPARFFALKDLLHWTHLLAHSPTRNTDTEVGTFFSLVFGLAAADS